MAIFKDVAARIFTGNLSKRAQGFLIVLPEGATGRVAMEATLRSVYGSSVHPDVFILQNDEGGPAKVDDVRAALDFAHTYPTAGGMKTLWVPESDLMNTQSANAFLKTLEEPSSSTRVIIGASRPEKLLPTTRSRCISLSAREDRDLARAELKSMIPESSDSDIEQALAAGNGAIDTAACILQAKGGLAWAMETRKAIENSMLMPVPPIGKNGIDITTMGVVLMVIFARMLRAGNGKAEAFMDAATPYLSDNIRPGIDMGGRSRALARAIFTA